MMFKSGNVTVMVGDMKRALQFYTETLGFRLKDNSDGHFALIEAPGLTIGLLHLDGEDIPQSEKSGSMSIGLEVDELESVVETLKSRGVDFHDAVDGKAAQVVHFNDPEGHTLYLVSSR